MTNDPSEEKVFVTQWTRVSFLQMFKDIQIYKNKESNKNDDRHVQNASEI